MDKGYGPIFPRPAGKGTGVYWGFVGCPTRESKAADGTVAHLSWKLEQQELLEQLELQKQQEQQAQLQSNVTQKPSDCLHCCSRIRRYSQGRITA